MIALVTGAEGFVAPYLTKELKLRKYEVIGTFFSPPKSHFKNSNLLRLDITNRDAVYNIIKKTKPNIVFNLAAINDIPLSIKDPKITNKVNVLGVDNLIRGLYPQNKNSTLVLIGSAQQYGIPKHTPVSENHPLNPLNPYAISKCAAEKIGIKFSKKINIILLRSFNHIGPGQKEIFVCSSFAKQIAEIEKGKPPILFVGNIKSIRDFTDVRDIVKAYIIAAEKCLSGIPFNVCSGKGYLIKDVLNILLNYSSVKIKIKKKFLNNIDIPVLIGDNTLFYLNTGWKPEISIEKSLLDILNYWRKSKFNQR